MNDSQALAQVKQPQSTGMGLFSQAPNQNALAATVVPLDRENLTFFANMIKLSGLIPVVKNVTPEQSFSRVMAKIVAGTSYGFDPILAQSCFDVVFNSLGLNANGKGILFRETGEFDLRFVYHSEEGCKVKVLRLINGKWLEVGEVEFNKAMAVQAGLLTGPMQDMWKKYPRDMYYARVITRAVKRFNPSCLKPKLILGNHFAKESQPQLAPPPAIEETNQLTNGVHDSEQPNAAKPAEAQDYIDVEYQDTASAAAADEDTEVPGEVTVTAEAETDDSDPAAKSVDSQIEDLKMAIGEKLDSLTEAQVKKVLDGRKISQMDLKQLQLFWQELQPKE